MLVLECLKEIMKLDQISMTFNQLKQNVRKSIQKVKTVHFDKYLQGLEAQGFFIIESLIMIVKCS